MKKILYLDLVSGISGDMTVGALIDLLDENEILRYKYELSTLKLENEFEIEINKKDKYGIYGTKFDVIIRNEDHKHTHDHTHNHGRNLTDITEVIDNSKISNRAKELSKEIFSEIARAEAKIHNKDITEVHFHEIGAIDSIIDIVSVGILIDMLGIVDVRAKEVKVGTGFVDCAHGKMPVPVPATLEILTGLPMVSTDIESELVTPTGAGILKCLVKQFGEKPDMNVKRVGYGVGIKDFDIPNILRAYIAEVEDRSYDEEMILFETNIDDMSSEVYSYLFDMLFSIGVSDVYTTNIGMKKNRPGIMISVLANKEIEAQVEEVLFKETTTFGIRKSRIDRVGLERQITRVLTSYGEVRIKIGRFKGDIIKVTPEYEDVKNIANRHCVPFFEVYNETLVRIKEIDLC